jgi:hypothetical protein
MEEGEDEGPQLMITGPESQRALALRNDGAVAKAGGQDKWKRGGKGGDQQGHQGPKRKKIRPPKRSGGPKVESSFFYLYILGYKIRIFGNSKLE